MKPFAIGALLSAVLISGCASQIKPSGVNEHDPAYQALVKSARNIEQSLSTLAESEQFEKMKEMPSQPRIYKQIPGMEQVITMPWTGTLEQAISRLAAFSGFEVKFMGKQPVTPILVQIGREPATVSDHMRNLGIQAGTKADVVVDPASKVVEVRYGNGAV